MVKARSLRRIGDPVVAGARAGVRIRTRIHPTPAEAAALATIGDFVGSLYRGELAGRVRLGRLDPKGQAVWRAQRKRALTAANTVRAAQDSVLLSNQERCPQLVPYQHSSSAT